MEITEAQYCKSEHCLSRQCGERNDRMLIETVLSMLTVACHAKKMRHRLASYF
jgi:hypothetical protein